MQYLLMIYGDEAKMAKANKADNDKMLAAYGAYAEAMQKAGVMRGGARLRPTADASTVRLKDGKSSVLNGPYADTREQLGGYFMIEAADLDEALAWAARCPGAAMGSVEVRPIWPM
jgi:hypothetical protein